MVNHPLAPPKSAGKLGRHGNQSGTEQRSPPPPPCKSWDAATRGEVPPTSLRGQDGVYPPHHPFITPQKHMFLPQMRCQGKPWCPGVG